MSDNESGIQRLIKTTTIKSVEDTHAKNYIHGSEDLISIFEKKYENPVDPIAVDNIWEKIWILSGNRWNKQLQNYRFFCDTFLLFRLSFKELMAAKVISLYEKDQKKKLHFNNLCGMNLYGVYHHGKKCCDLMKELELIKEESDKDFCRRFSEIRNKFIEHNYNRDKIDLQMEPDIWSLIGTDSFLQITIHSNSEGAYKAIVDYYDDYYRLEKVVLKALDQILLKTNKG